MKMSMTIPKDDDDYHDDLNDIATDDEKTIQRNLAIAHFKGPADFMPYCGNALLPYTKNI